MMNLLLLIMASSILLLFQLGLTTAFQSSLPLSLSSIHPQQAVCQWPSTASASAAVVEETELIERTKDPPDDWDEQFEKLQSFKEEHGHCNFPQNASMELQKQYPTLASFCHRQRIDYMNLRADRRRSRRMGLTTFDRNARCCRLKEIGFEFHTQRAKWYDHYYELLQYRSDNGHLRVTESENSRLYAWIFRQRQIANGEDCPNRSEAHVKLLENIGFTWKSERKDALWMEKYQELVDSRNKHGHLLVDYKSKLYEWISVQRKRSNSLTDERKRLLDEIEFPWKGERFFDRWLAKYNELEEFHKIHGHCQPCYVQNLPLYDWVRTQRVHRDNGVLSTSQIQLLDDINFAWERKVTWRTMFAELVEYYNLHEHLQVNQGDDPELYDWMALQRKHYHDGIRKKKMSDISIEKLEEINFCWSQDWKERVWHEMYTEAVEFYKEHSHVRVKKKDNPSLYNWIATQGKRYKKTKGHKPLSEEELELLEQIDFVFFNNQPRMSWNVRYAELERYREENDGCFPDHRDDPKLNLWIRQQRKRLRSSYGYIPLSDEQKSMLESIDFPILPKGHDLRVWYEMYDELVEFWKRHGHFLVTQYEPENRKLLKWVDYQRSKYNGCGCVRALTNSEKYLLERIGFPWTSGFKEMEWQTTYAELVRFQQKHGHLQVTKREDRELYNWIKYQRDRYANKGPTKVPTHQIEQLNKIGFRWVTENDD
ncbi:unnamed protein product [Cylindrotheca closterium]|uniref:Helicase-associated domain-containing protein n=1 Tax=Cylindrotheca closterium TaxID=2856 RepID=A0AAD2CH68_9STRA|nr:unnamed protein product [Cylindrotheca closterium]